MLVYSIKLIYYFNVKKLQKILMRINYSSTYTSCIKNLTFSYKNKKKTIFRSV